MGALWLATGAAAAAAAALSARLCFALGLHSARSHLGACGVRGTRESLTACYAAEDSLKAEDIGKMYATGDSEMDELADTTWKEHFRSAFQSMDHDQDGKISLGDFDRAVSGMGEPFTNLKEGGVESIFALADSNSDGALDFDEFIAWQKSTRGLLESFSQLDLDRDGLIGKEEWRQALGLAGVDWTPEECADNFDDADLNGDGYLDFAEYTRWAAKA